MFKKLMLFMFVSALFISCGSNDSKTTEEEVIVQEKVSTAPVKITVAEFNDNAAELVGKIIHIEGTVDHACKHGGKRMFIIDENPDVRVKIEAGENIPAFDAELEGSEVIISGKVEELIIDEAYLTEWEKELEQEGEASHKIHEGEPGHEKQEADEDHSHQYNKIKNYREELKESGKDHISYYFVECIKFEVVPPPTPDN